LELTTPARSGARVAGLGACRVGSKGTADGAGVALGSSSGVGDAGQRATGWRSWRATGVTGRRVPGWRSRRWSSAPTAPGGEAGVAAAACLGGGGWRTAATASERTRCVGGREWQLWAWPGARVGNIHLTYDGQMCAVDLIYVGRTWPS
jgi:hypothetical protein